MEASVTPAEAGPRAMDRLCSVLRARSFRCAVHALSADDRSFWLALSAALIWEIAKFSPFTSRTEANRPN